MRDGPWLRASPWLLLLLSVSASAAVVEALDVDGLVQRSNLVLRGKVEGSESSWDDSGRRIFTRTRIRVKELLFTREGVRATVGSVVEVHCPGGAVGKIGQMVPGSPRFVLGEEVLLFLESTPQGWWTPVGLSLGKFSIRPGEQEVVRAVRDLRELHYPSKGEGVVEPGDPAAPPEEISMPEVLQAIDRAKR